jgi:hypothetical protein
VFDIRDDSSPVFRGYGEARDKFYRSKGASVTRKAVAPPNIAKQAKSVTIASLKNQ